MSDPTNEEVEAVARAIASNLNEQDYGDASEDPFPNGGLSWRWLDQGTVDFAEVARAAIIRLDQVRNGSAR